MSPGHRYILNKRVAQHPVDAIMQLTGGHGVDLVIDTTPKATRPVLDALLVARRGGTVCLAGIKSDAVVDGFVSDTIVVRSLRVLGMFSCTHDAYAAAVKMLERSPGDVSSLLTHRFPLTEADRAIRTLAGEEGSAAVAIAVMPWL